MRLTLHPAVTGKDLPDIYAFIARADQVAADRVLEAVDATFLQILTYPECGVMYRTRNSRMMGVRMLPVETFRDYLVFYRIDGEAIRILHVVHGSRHLPSLFARRARE